MLHALFLCHLSLSQTPAPVAERELSLSAEQVRAAGAVAGLELEDDELELMLSGVCKNLAAYEKLDGVALENSDGLALGFSALGPESTGAREARPPGGAPKHAERALPNAKRPANLDELAFAEIGTLAALVRSRQVTCSELVELSLARLKRLDPELLCVVTLCEERARAQAAERDLELERGTWRGPLHGIPWGAKDLLATAGIRTTWGSRIFEHQVPAEDATVVKKLDQAGAILVAKLSLGELAWGDVWYGGTTKNPWKREQGSSGS